MIRSATSARHRVLAVVTFLMVLIGSAAVAAAAPAPGPAPRDALREALRATHALVPQGSASAGPASAAVAALARATQPELWINSREADAPPYGKNVFTASADAVGDLESLAESSPPGRTTAVTLIVAADRGLAEDAIAQGRGGTPALLASAKEAFLAGNRHARAGAPAEAVDSYADAWQSSSDALARLVASEVTSVPAGALAAAAEQALGGASFGMAGPIIEQPATPLMAGGKPEIFYAGSEACPFCGVQRWGMIVALSQFGTFSHLHLMQSIATTHPQISTFTFFGSSYQSPYISFVPVEVWNNLAKPLQPLTHPERALFHKFDPTSQTPFIDVADRFVTVDSTVDPHLLAHKSWTQLADAITDSSNVSTQAIAGEAEVLTAELCEATGGNPQAVCSSTVVQQYETALPTLHGQGGSCPAPGAPGGPPPASDAAARAHRTGSSGPVATAARCQG